MKKNPASSKFNTQQKQNRFISKLAKLSFILEGIPMKSTTLILAFFLIQTLLDVIVPCFLLMANQENHMQFIDKLLKFLLFCNDLSGKFINDLFVGQFLLNLVFIGTAIALIAETTEKVQTIALYLMKFYFCAFNLILFIQILTLLHFIELNSSLSKFGSILCVLNSLLVLLFCIFYQILAHSYSTVSQNDLCCRFSFLHIVRSLGIKIISLFILILVTIKLFRPDILGNIQIINILCLIVLLIICISRIKNQVCFFTYISQISAKIYQACLILETSCIVNTLLNLMTNLKLLSQNYVFSMCSLSLFSYLSITAYLGTRSQNIHLKSQEQVTKQEEIILLIIELNKIFQAEFIKSAQLTQHFMIKNIYKRHEESCVEVSCYCKNKQIIDNDAMLNQYKRAALSFMDENACSVQVMKFILYAKLQIHKNFVGLAHLTKIFENSQTTKKSFCQALFFQKYNLALKQYLTSCQNSLNIAQTQKCLQAAQLSQIMIMKMSDIIQLRGKFWRVLYKGVIEEEIQQNVEQQLNLLKEIYSLVQKILHEFHHNILLINLSIGYEKSILMKDKISKHLIDCMQKFRISNLNMSKMTVKLNKKQKIQENMYQKSSCAIQVSIDKLTTGKIINTSKNIANVFGFAEKDLMGQNINSLMPKIMQKQHDNLLRNWSQNCSWTNIGQLRNIFCMSKNNICFSSKIYLKPVLRTDCVNLIGCFFKENEQDYMIVDNNGIIVAAGTSFINTLGPSIINLPLGLIMEDISQFKKWSVNSDHISRTYAFYPTKMKMQLFEQYQQDKCLQSTKKIIEQRIQASKNSAQKLNLKLNIRQIRMGKIKFKIIKLDEIIQIRPTRNIQSLKMLTLNLTGSKDLIKYSSENSQKQEQKMFINYNPSVSSSNGAQPTATHNVIYKMEKIFYGISKIYDRRSLNIVVVVLVLCLIGIMLDVGKIYINEKGFKQMQELFFADGACSDNLQISMFIYNNAMTLNKQLKTNEKALQDTLNKTQTSQNLLKQLRHSLQKQKYQQNYLYHLVSEEIKYYNSNRTSLTNINIYKYENNLVKWRGTSEHEQQIQTTTFIVNYLYFSQESARLVMEITDILTKNQADQLQKLEKLRAELTFYLNILKQNFAELVKMNTDNLDYYADLLIDNKEMIKTVTYIKTAGTIVIFLILLVLLNKHFNYRRDQATKIYSQYRYIPTQRASELIQYYSSLGSILKEDDLTEMKKIANQTISQTIQLKTGALFRLNEMNDRYNLAQLKKQGRLSDSLKITVKKPKLYLQRIFLVMIFLCMVGVNILMETAEERVLSKSEEIVKFINQLMDSENELISTYFEQKAQEVSGVSLSHQQLTILLQKIKTVEVKFSTIAMDSLLLFSAYDPDYVQKMSKILTESVCELTKNDLPLEQYERCIKDGEMDIITHGIINGMNYFGRQIQSLIWKQIKTIESGEKVKNYSLSKVDKSMFHMFKIYQKTQSQIMNSLVIVINNQKTEYMVEIVVQLLFFLAFLWYIAKFYFKQNRQCALLIGKILLLPVSLIKNDLKILRNFEKIVDYQNIVQR